MDKLLASAEQRKRDYLIAQEKKYKKERDLEGEEFAGKEKFVTNAYKRQQEELRKTDEEEKLREGNYFQLVGIADVRKRKEECTGHGIILQECARTGGNKT